MIFNSIQFIIFLPIVVILYYLLPFKYRWILLLAASYYFYLCWNVNYIVLLLSSTIIDYVCAIMMDRYHNKRSKLLFLWISAFSNFGMLFTFKYYNFFIDSINYSLNFFSIGSPIPFIEVLLPVGISFYIFQTFSYVVDVYQGTQKAEKHFGYFALYVTYFPQLVAGPIERYTSLAPQLQTKHTFEYKNLANGLRLVLFGLFIKMVIADNLCLYVDRFYKDPALFNSLTAWKIMILYSFQIYSDFHGYSTVAIGSALMMGVHLMDNFRTPYLSKSIGEFWQRWHISLSTWFRDYLYLPLGGNKVRYSRWAFNIFIVFAVSGLWHGANWTFVIWGCLYGILYIVEKKINTIIHWNSKQNASNLINVFLILKNFLLVSLIWVLFRSQNLSQAKTVFLGLINPNKIGDDIILEWQIVILFSIFLFLDYILYNTRFDIWIDTKPSFVRWLIYGILILSVIAFTGTENFPFIYFQF